MRMRNFPVAQVILIGARGGPQLLGPPFGWCRIISGRAEDQPGAGFPSDAENSPRGGVQSCAWTSSHPRAAEMKMISHLAVFALQKKKKKNGN